jgi:ABC-type glycerol-3-phosphate transport system permease component
MTTAVQKTTTSPQSVQKAGSKYSIGQIVTEIVKYLILIPLAASFIFPIYWMFSSALKDDPQVFTIPPVLVPNPAFWENFVNAWNLLPFDTFAFNTIFRFVLPVTIITVIASTVVAYGFAKIPWRGREVVFWIVLLTLMLPWAVKMVPVFITLRYLDWLDSYKFWTVTALFGSPYFIFMLRQFFRSIPEDLSEAARIDGANELTILFRVILPLSKPALAVVALFRFLAAWNDYLGPKLFIRTQENYPLALGIDLLSTRANDVGNCVRCLPYLMAVSALVALPVIIAFFFAQRTFIEGINLTGTKG